MIDPRNIGMSSAIADLITRWKAGDRVPQAAFPWPRDRWIAAFPEHTDTLRSLPDEMDRDTVRRACIGAAASPLSAERAFLAVMAWGFGSVGYGQFRVRRILTSTPDAGSRLARVAETLISNNALSAYTMMGDECRLPGLGPAFGTKFLFFCQPPDRAPRALILDSFVAEWLKREGVADLNPIAWSKRTYGTYLTLTHSWAAALNCNAEDIEYCIFQAMSVERGGQWGDAASRNPGQGAPGHAALESTGDGGAGLSAQPIWKLAGQCAERLTAAGRSPFKLRDIIDCIRRTRPDVQQWSVSPVVQGMTVNAPGGVASPGAGTLVRVGHGLYTLNPAAGQRPPPRPAPPDARSEPKADAALAVRRPGARRRIGLVGCVKGKLDSLAPARDLYTSPLFIGQRRAVEESCDQWFVLSARHGLIDPDRVTEPYEESLGASSREHRRAWNQRVLAEIEARLAPLTGLEFEIHAGKNYYDFGLEAGLVAKGATVVVPARGLDIFRKSSFYAQRRTAPPPAIAPVGVPRPADLSASPITFPMEHPLFSRAAVLASPCPVPSSPGIYAWFFKELPTDIDVSRCLHRDGAALLYVGIAPHGEGPSRGNLRLRLRQHYAGTAEGSTLRLTLGCLIGLELRRVGSRRVRTFGDQEQALSAWMDKNALVTWMAVDRPWEEEKRLIGQLDLPLNLAQNSHNSFHKRLTSIRAEARRRADAHVDQ